MTTSAKALAVSAAPASIPKHERDLSEQFRLIGEEWSDLDSAATLYEELKSTTLAKMKSKVMAERGDMPDARAERIVKSSLEWEAYIRDMCAARSKALKLKVQLDVIRMKHSEWIGRDANARAERRY